MDVILKDLFHKRDVLDEIKDWYWQPIIHREIEHRLHEIKKMIDEIEVHQMVWRS